ncbi:MAG: DNA polymerase III subunit gamma/tau, partial [Acidimicrobiales bacterium]
VGQDHVKVALKNALVADTVGHAYLFSGPRGTGKTSMARILAKALNCDDLTDGEPCGICDSCESITAGTSLDVYELDAASNNSVDDIRQLVASTALGSAGRTKVYVLDEVHMLSKAASNALLKTLEEPPAHVVFVLATTDPQKVLPTIRSRTQHYEFRLLAADDLAAHVRMVIQEAALAVDDDMVDEIVRRGGGSARDTLSILDQVSAAGGVAESGADVDEIVAGLIANDVTAVLGAVASAVSGGADPREMGESLTRHLRDMFLTLMGVDAAELPDSVRAEMHEQATALGAARTVKAMEAIGLALTEMRQATDARLTLEVALIQLAGLSSLGVVQPVAEAVPAVLTETPAVEAPVIKEPATVTPPVEAREALERSPAPPTPKSASKKPTPAPEPEPVSKSETVLVPESAGEYPDVATLNQDWHDQIMAKASGKVRALYSAGRFEEVANGRAVIALPTGPHMVRCDPIKPGVEALLEEHYGVPIALDLIVEGQTRPVEAPVVDKPLEPDALIDLDALTDAHDAPTTSLQLLQEAFPGAELEPNDEAK